MLYNRTEMYGAKSIKKFPEEVNNFILCSQTVGSNFHQFTLRHLLKYVTFQDTI